LEFVRSQNFMHDLVVYSNFVIFDYDFVCRITYGPYSQPSHTPTGTVWPQCQLLRAAILHWLGSADWQIGTQTRGQREGHAAGLAAQNDSFPTPNSQIHSTKNPNHTSKIQQNHVHEQHVRWIQCV
jgi:hypothetical protein